MALAKLFSILAVAVINILWINTVSSEFTLELEPKQLVNKKTGDSIFVRCLVKDSNGEGETSLSWRRVRGTESEKIPSTGRVRAEPINGDTEAGLDLLFFPVEKDDEGQYKCVGSSGGETDEASISFTLFEQITFVDCPTVQNPQAGSDAEIRCRVTADPMPDDISWSKDGSPINDASMNRDNGFSFLENNMVLSLPNYDPDSDDGVYEVRVLQMQSADMQLRKIEVAGYVAPKLIEHPEEITQGYEESDLKLSCSATGRPQPEYKWYKGASASEGELLDKTGDKYNVEDKGQLVIYDLEEEDAVSYTCLAINDVASDKWTTTVNVFKKPSIEPIANVTKSRYEKVSLECRYEGDGQITVQWAFKGTILEAPSSDEETTTGDRVYATASDGVLTLHIDSVSLDDADEYQCKAWNDAGEAMRRVFLSVNHPPLFVRKSDDEIRTLMMTEVDLFCEVEAVPKPEWIWTAESVGRIEKDLKISDDGLRSELTVDVDQETDFGEYICEASNGVGKVSGSIKLIRIVSPPTPSLLDTAEDRFPNSAIIFIKGFGDLIQGSEPDEVVFYFAREDEIPVGESAVFWNTTAQRASLPFVSSDPEVEYRLPGLKPETMYSIRARSVNQAGTSSFSEVLNYQTSAPRVPMRPVFVNEWHSKCEETCVIHWEEPDDQGSDVTEFQLAYYPVEEENGLYKKIGDQMERTLDGHERKIRLYNLQPNTFYKFMLKATNNIGQGEAGEVVIQTGETGYGVGVSTGAIVGIVIVIILIVLVLVDVTCYYVNHCGVLMCLCVNLCGKESPDVKNKEIHLEEGHTQKNDDMKPLNQAEAEDKAAVDNEHTPMIDEPGQKKDTTV